MSGQRTLLTFLLLATIRHASSQTTKNTTPHQTCRHEPTTLPGHLQVDLLDDSSCNPNTTTPTYTSLSTWIVKRLNTPNISNSSTSIRLGLTSHRTCQEPDYYDALFTIFKKRRRGDAFFDVFAISDHLSDKILQFASSLDVHLESVDKNNIFAIEASLKLLQILDLSYNISVLTDDRDVLAKFYKTSRAESMCVSSGILFDAEQNLYELSGTRRHGPVVILSKEGSLNKFLRDAPIGSEISSTAVIFVPFGEFGNFAYPEGSYVVRPNSASLFDNTTNQEVELSPLLFDIAVPMLKTFNITKEYCEASEDVVKCLRSVTLVRNAPFGPTPQDVLVLLGLEDSEDIFSYSIFLVQNSSRTNLTDRSFEEAYRYKIFAKTITSIELDVDLEPPEKVNTSKPCSSKCVNFQTINESLEMAPETYYSVLQGYHLRQEPWVFAVLSMSLLGVIFCVAIMVFFVVRICKRDILEGNPFLTLLLLVTTAGMFCSVIPFALRTHQPRLQNHLIVIRVLSTTLVYAFTFSLILSRSILLATVSRDVGFMSHVPGPVQSFLTLFMFAVQGALSLQLINHCEDVFRGYFFVYLMSYNVILLILLLFICPLNARTHRNYREGRYFTVAVVVIAVAWSCWIPLYAVLEDRWRDVAICCGLVATASSFLGAVLVPRTYMMTVAAAKDRLTAGGAGRTCSSSLPANSSIMDVYRASTQPIYDCINIAAINSVATTLARDGSFLGLGNGIPSPPPQPHPLYSTVTRSFDDELDFQRCITPSQDKVTRF